MMFDEAEVRKAIGIMKPDNRLFEVRLVFDGTRHNVLSGYFRDADTLIRELKKVDLADCNVYITLNSLFDACYDRKQRDCFKPVNGTATSDNDIEGYDWILVDLDPKRPKGTASTDEQLKEAKVLGNKVFKFMRQIGFNAPLTAYSGNGVHLLYPILLSNTDENKRLVEKCLKVLNILFSTDNVSVDVANFNPSRICKLYGTVSTKGLNTPERPHRLSRIVTYPESLEPTDMRYLKKLTEVLPSEPERNQRYNNWNANNFDLEAWMDKYGIRYRRDTVGSDTRYVLEHCPFDESHNKKDAAIFRMANGAIGFKCFHNSCADKHWADVRRLFEPDYKEQRWNDTPKIRYNRDRRPEPKPIVEVKGEPIFLTGLDVLNKPQEEEVFIKTGTQMIDQKMRGLKKGALSIVSGLRGSAKSTLLSQWALEAVEQGYRVGVFSGELSDQNFFRWADLQAAGRANALETKYEGFYTISPEHRKMIRTWEGDKLYLYNNKYGNDFLAVIDEFEKKIDSDKLDLLILDNLMAFDTRTLSDNKFEAQTQFVLKLKNIAEMKDVHIAFVAHPRKAMGFLRLDDISGSADLANAVDNAFIVHRNNNDFQRLSAQMFGWHEDDAIYEGTNVVEIAKDRDGGNQDVFIPLYYERETKRLKNDFTENRIYSWGGDSWSSAPQIEGMVFQ